MYLFLLAYALADDEEGTKIFVGANCLYSNGSLMSRVGTAPLCMIGKQFNVPVIAVVSLSNSLKRSQLDSFVFNELADPDHFDRLHFQEQFFISELDGYSSVKVIESFVSCYPSRIYYNGNI